MHDCRYGERTLLAGFVFLPLCLLLAACGEPNKRLDEYLFYAGPVLQLKVVRYYRNIPFNYLGEHALVMCRSEHTRDFQKDDAQDAGWRILGDAGGQGSQNAREVALVVQDNYRIINDHILVVKQQVLNISFDACGSFANWDPTRLPPGMVETVEKPDSCAPAGPVDCRYLDFDGERAPHYETIEIAAAGQASFTVISPAFRNVTSLQVRTRNNGVLWHVDTVLMDDAEQDLPAGTLQALSLPLPESGLETVTLEDWLESVLPPRSMVVWPRRTVGCNNTAALASPGATSQCAEIRFSDSAGNHGVISITVDDGLPDTAGKPSFHSAVYNTADASHPVKSLSQLRDLLATATSTRP